MLVSQMYKSWSDMYGEFDNLTADTKLVWANMINNEVYDQLLNANIFFFQKEFTINTTGATEYDLPADFYTVDFYSLGLFDKDKQVEYLFRTKGDKLILANPIDSGLVLKLVYVPRLTPITDLEDELVIPDYATEVAIYSVDLMFAKRDRDYGLAQNISMLLNEAYVNMLERFKTSPSVYAVNDLTSGF